MNVRSLPNKLHQLETLFIETTPDIVVLTETWTSEKHSNPSISISNYEIVSRSDRLNTKDGKGGGLVIYAKLEIATQIIDKKIKTQICDIQMCHLKIRDTTIIAIYRSPKTSAASDELLIAHLRAAPDMSVILGDFNLPKVSWDNPARSPQTQQMFNELVMDRFWEQHVKKSTHIAGNILDLYQHVQTFTYHNGSSVRLQ
jgi:exonuclease III